MDPMHKSFIYGLRPVQEAIESGAPIDKVLIKEGLKHGFFRAFFAAVRKYEIPYQFVPQAKLNSITQKNHQGAVALMAPVEFQHIEDIIPGIFEKGKVPFIVLLDQLTDVRNFGAIVRTAECAGVHSIVISGKHFARIGPDAAKTSAGALYKIPLCRVSSLAALVDFLQKSGIQVVAVTEKASSNYVNLDFQIPTALVMGSEDQGISASLLKKIDQAVKIPVNGDLASLNVSVAAGIMMYEVVRQRNLSLNRGFQSSSD